MEFNSILLAAGIGSRLRPLTDHWPKCLMPVHGKPLMEYWLSEFFENDLKAIFVNTSHLHEIVEDYLKRARFGHSLNILYEEELLGTGGTLLSIKGQLMTRPSLVAHADNWCGMKLGTLLDHHINHRPSTCPITMMTFSTDTPRTCGIVETDTNNIVVAFHEKQPTAPGNKANAAIYVIEPEVITWMEEHNAIDFSTGVIANFVGKIYTVHNYSFHRDIGNIDSLRHAQTDPKRNTCWMEDDAWLVEFSQHPIHQMISQRTI